MTPIRPDPAPDPELELRRVADRLAALGPQRLQRPDADGRLPAERVREVLQQLADLAADAEGDPRHDVPRLAPHALADQLRVLAADALAAADDDGRSRVREWLVALRRAL